jgi:hypothetical protein
MGEGIQPEVESKPKVEAIKRRNDFKAETVSDMIKKDKEKNPPCC